MSLVSQRIQYLLDRYDAQEISTVTGLPLTSISPVLQELEPVEPAIRKNIYNFYNRTIYGELRKAGASAAEARRYRNKSVDKVIARIEQRSTLLEDLAQLRLSQYRVYLQNIGAYVSDEATLDTLRQAIARQMGRSKLPPSHYDYESYPTLDYGVLDDDY